LICNSFIGNLRRVDPLRVGIVGTGNICGIYIENLHGFSSTHVIACADLDVARAVMVAKKADIPLALAPEDLLAHPDVDLVLNLTPPPNHAEIALAAVAAGKHVYNEKPLAVEFGDGRALLADAARHGVRVGGAPDTFLGAGHQTARSVIDSGRLGQIVSVNGFMLCGGHESWHPSPAFYYARGGGPLFDMGPYYLSAFVNMFGPMVRVTGATSTSRPVRMISSEPLRGQEIKVETPTHVTGVFEFANGVIGQLTTSFDVPVGNVPPIVVCGTEGSMVVPDPNAFGGELRSRRYDETDWTIHTSPRPFEDNSRGLGVLDLALAIRDGRAHRASGALALHVLESMHAVLRSAQSGRHIKLETTVERPEPMPERGLE